MKAILAFECCLCHLPTLCPGVICSASKDFNFLIPEEEIRALLTSEGLLGGLNEAPQVLCLLPTLPRADTGQMLYCDDCCWYGYSLPAGPASLAQENAPSSSNRTAPASAR